MRKCPRDARYRVLAASIVMLTVAGVAQAGDNPGFDRPGIGFTPTVLAAGDVTWEQGLPDWSRSGGVSLYTADSLLRVGLGGPLELQLGGSYNRLTDDNASTSGRGGSSVGLKFALPTSGTLSWGLLGSVAFTDGARAFRTNQRQYLLGAAFNWQLNALDSLGAYLQTDGASGNWNDTLAVNVGRTVTDAIGIYAEVAWQHAADVGNGSMAGAGITWMATPRVQLDASFRHRLGGQIDTWQAGLGVSVFFSRL